VTDPGSQCYVLDRDQCTAEQWETVENGTALVRNWIVVDANTTNLFPDLVNGTQPNGTYPSGTGGMPMPTVSSPPELTGAAVRKEVAGGAILGAVLAALGLML
jgi:hypothetical protein